MNGQYGTHDTHKVNRISGSKRFCRLGRNFFHQAGNQYDHVSEHSELHRGGFIFKSLHVLINTAAEHISVSVRVGAALSPLVTCCAGNVSHRVSSCQCQMKCCWRVAPTAANWLMFFFFFFMVCVWDGFTDLIIHIFDFLWPGTLMVFQGRDTDPFITSRKALLVWGSSRESGLHGWGGGGSCSTSASARES